MREPIFKRESGRSWSNIFGPSRPAVRLSIYEPDRFTGSAPFDAFVSSPAGYTVFKTIEDLEELRGFLSEAIEAHRRHTLMPVESKSKEKRVAPPEEK